MQEDLLQEVRKAGGGTYYGNVFIPTYVISSGNMYLLYHAYALMCMVLVLYC